MTDKVKIIARPNGQGRVWLNDREISHIVVCARLNLRVGKPTTVTLELNKVDVELMGDVAETAVKGPE